MNRLRNLYLKSFFYLAIVLSTKSLLIIKKIYIQKIFKQMLFLPWSKVNYKFLFFVATLILEPFSHLREK